MNESGLIPSCEKFIKDHPDELLVLEVFELLHLFNNKRLRELSEISEKYLESIVN